MTTKEPTPRAQNQTIAPRYRSLAPLREFPLLLNQSHDDVYRLLARLALWPKLWGGRVGWRWCLEFDENDDALVIRAEAPGYDPADFDIRVNDEQLILRASKKAETTARDESAVGRREQDYYEVLVLPPDIDTNNVAARYHGGILTVTLPKTPRVKAKRIVVQG